MKPGELTRAFLIVWFVAGAAVLAILATPWLVDARHVAAVVPACEWKARYGKACPVCGMTTAFYAIREGRWRDASEANAGSIPLYSAFVINEMILVCWLVKRRAC